MFINNPKIKEKIDKGKIFLEKYETKLSILFFIVGFLIDNLTLDRIDSISNNLILLSWLFIAIIFIFINNYGDYWGFKNNFLFKLYSLSPYIIQFAFGALFSGFVIYYTRSSTFFDSWPFFILLYFLFIANEKLKNQYENFTIQFLILYFTILSFNIFYIPILFKKSNLWTFSASIILSLLIILFLWKIFKKFFPPVKIFRKWIFSGILFVSALFIFFQYKNLLPPVPLSAKTINVYHYVEKVDVGKYIGLDEEYDFWDRWFKFKKEIHRKPDERICIFSSIFAPTDFRTKVYYQGFWWDEENKIWREIFKSHKINVLGGRDNGFRIPYCLKNSIKDRDGLWKIYIKANNNAVIDRLEFVLKTIPKDQYIPLKKIDLK